MFHLVSELASQLNNLRLQNQITQGFKYTKEIRQYLYFTMHYKLQPFPTKVDTMVCFLEFMARTSGHPHLKHFLFSVKFAHEALDMKFPVDSFQLDTTMQGLKRRLKKNPLSSTSVDPIYPKENVCSS